MPKYKLPNGKTIFSETELTLDELDELASEGEEKFEPLTGVSLNKTADAPVAPEVQPEEPNLWDRANAPIIDAPSQGARQLSGYSQDLRKDVENPFLASVLGFAEGAQEGLGDLASSLTSPLNLITTALTGGSSIAAKAALPTIARTLSMGARGLSAGVGLHGGQEVIQGEGLAEKGGGLLELIGGILGMKQGLPKITKSIAKGELPKVTGISGSNQADDLLENIPRDILEAPAEITGQDVSSPSSYGPVKEGTPHIPSKTPFTSDQYTLETLSSDLAYLREKGKPIPQDLLNKMEELTGKRVPSDIDVVPNIDTKPPKPKNLITDKGDVIDEATGEVIDMTDTGTSPIKPPVKPPVLAETPSIHPESKQPIDPIKHKPNVKMVSEKEGILNNPSVETVQQMNDGGYYTKKVNEDGTLTMTKRAPKPKVQGEPESLLREIYNLPRGMMSVDLPFATSAAFRQAKPFIGTANWFKAWKTAASSFKSEEAFQNVMNRINNEPLFKKRLINGKIGPSVADEMGLDMTDLRGINGREEALRSSLAEKIPLYGKYIRASNRAYTGFLNDLRANTLGDLFDSANALGRDPITKDKVLGQQIAEFINTATGRGRLGVEIGSKQISLEKNAKLMADVFFAPKLMASNVRMLNPSTYITADPFVRKQYMLGMLRTMGTWGTIAGMAKLAGADVTLDPRSSDFGKIKIGNTRIDLGGGMQQYLVLAAREAPGFMGGGKTISSTSGKVTEMGKGFKAPTRMSTAVDFGANKLHPTAKFAWDLMSASEDRPVGVGDRITEMALPMYVGDLKEILEEHPELAPLILGLTSVGIGSQTYEGGPPAPTIIPRKYDYVYKGR